MDKKQATQIIQNLVIIHRNIHWGSIKSSPTSSWDRYSINYSKEEFIFYYQAFSEYACDLDNYMTSAMGEGVPESDLPEFESNVRIAIERMTEYIEGYNINLYAKKNFIERSGISDVFKILDIDLDSILKRISDNHTSLIKECKNNYLSFYDQKINCTLSSINNDINSNKKFNKHLFIRLEAMKNLQKLAEKNIKIEDVTHKIDTAIFDKLVPESIYHLALTKEIELLKKDKKKEKLRKIFKI
ncbi:TPA: hypothetical protein ACRVI2_000741 [Staphylococcus aureus]